MIWRGTVPQGAIGDDEVTPADIKPPRSVRCPECRGAKCVRKYANDPETVQCGFCEGHGRLELKRTETYPDGLFSTYGTP